MNGNSSNFTPREYQVELVNRCLKRNVIVCLGTGAGKTFIAVMLIQEKSDEIRKPYQKGVKRTFFLAKTVPLVSQQADVIKLHTGLAVGQYIGAMGVDRWKKETWEEELEKNQVLVMTTQILTNCLNHSFITPSDINLLIVDECHHAVGNDPTVEIMARICDFPKVDHPKILGLTASVLNGKCKPSQVLTKIRKLETVMMSTVETATDNALAKLHATDPKENIVACKERTDDDEILNMLIAVVEAARIEIEGTLPKEDDSEDSIEIEQDEQEDYGVILGPSVKFTSLLRDVAYVLKTLGLWSGYQLSIQLSDEIKKMIPDLAEECQQRGFIVQNALKIIIETFLQYSSCRSNEDIEAMEKFSSHKVKRLLEVLHTCKVEILGDGPVAMEIGDVYDGSHNPLIMPQSSDDADEDDDDDNIAFPEQPKQTASACLPSLMAIVFVERRSTAWVLSKYLQTISQFTEKFSYIKADYVMGHGCDPMRLKYAQMKVRLQHEKIKKFRTGDCNVLVATRVVEEGMDIPTCNIVLRFDEPKDFRSYIQSKGRARAKDAHYIILTNESDERRLSGEVEQYQSIEKGLLEICHGRLPPTEREIDERLCNRLLEPYYASGKQGPMVSMNSSIDLVNRYCDLLPHDKFTKLSAKVKYRKVEFDRQTLAIDVDEDDEEELWDEYDPKPHEKIEEEMAVCCILWMPINCPIRERVEGDPMPTKKLAKKAVALKMCRLLHEAGELNDYLVPIAKDQSKFLKELVDIEEDVVEKGKPKPGTAKRRQIYPKKIAPALMDALATSGKPCYLYRIQTTLVRKLDLETFPVIYDPESSHQCFGILTTKELPEVDVFPLNTRVGQIQVKLVLEKETALQDKDLNLVKHFHKLLFTEVVGAETYPLIFSPEFAEFCVYIVPLVENVDSQTTELYLFDWDLMETTLLTSINRRLPSDQERSKFKFSAYEYRDAVVASLHRKPYHYYIVEQVLSTVDARHPFPDGKYKDFAHYYNEKYGIQVQHLNHPLLRVKILGGCKNMLPERVPRTGKVKTIIVNGVVVPQMDLFLPELCEIHPIPGPLWLKAQCIPSILHRLNSLYLCRDLAMEMMLGSASDIADMYPHARQSLVVEQYRQKCIQHEFSWGTICPLKRKLVTVLPGKRCCLDSTVVLESLTTMAANDCINLERLEVIGDSFLKYTSSIFLFCEYSTADEGKLSLGRGKLISNSYLYHLAKQKGINSQVLVQIFSPCTKWCPPGFAVDKEKVERLVTAKVPYHAWHLLQGEKWQDCTPSELLELLQRKMTAQKKLRATSEDTEVKPEILECEENVFNEATCQLIADKSVADCIEALIGANLICIGPHAALDFMIELGIRVLPQNNDDEFMDPKKKLKPLNIPKTGYLTRNQTASKERLNFFAGFEEKINYFFNDKSFLIEAFTHPTYSANVLTNCYQRLEFLGDAILDYLVTWELFQYEKKYCPGELSTLRSALVNNVTFARLAVEMGYNHYLKSWSPGLFTAINKFLILLSDETEQDDQYLLKETDTLEEDEVEVPKALGDVFESVAGAIYLDSGMSLDAVWQVYHPIMKPTIDKYVADIPKEPVRAVHEMFPDIKFEKAKQVIEEGEAHRVLHEVSVTVRGKKFTGIGKGSKHAKQNAAKCVLRYLSRRSHCESKSTSNGVGDTIQYMDLQ